MSLHDELQRIADQAPTADVPHDTWRRARRARTRDRALTLGAVAAVLALIAGAVAWLPDRAEAPVADSHSHAALPTVLHAVPQRLSVYDEGEHRWPDDVVTDDLAMGRGVAAWVSQDTLPVVVGATDGEYHLLDLPGWSGKAAILAYGTHPPALALSPDGRTLAFSYADLGPESATEPVPSGVRLLDLVSGSVDDVPLPGEEGTAVTSLAWAPSGLALGWAGRRLGSWTQSSTGQATSVAGVIDPRTFAVTEVASGRAADRLSYAGESIGASGLRTSDDGTLRARRDPGFDQPRDIAALPGGRRLVLSPDPTGDTGTRSIELDGDGVTRHGVAVVEDGTMRSLTIATGLIDPEHPSTARPAPDWPWSDEHKVVVFGGGAAILLLLVMILPAVRRQSRHPR